MRTVILSVMLIFTLLRTQSSSQHWISRTTPTIENLNDIYFTTNDSGWAVGDNGAILFSADGGETWVTQNVPSPQDLNGVYFFDSHTGWVVGTNGTVLSTMNSGQTWTGKVIPDLNNDLGFITFADNIHGWILATNSPYNHNFTTTTDGGDTWQVGQGPVAAKLYSIAAFGPDILWVTSINGQVFYSDNGGVTWENRDTNLDRDIYSIVFVDSKQGWVANDRGRIWHTTDGGLTWNEQNTPISGQIARIYKLAFSDTLNGWGASNRGILYTNNGGLTWDIESNLFARSVMFMSKIHGWAVGDGGQIWEYRAADENIVADETFLDKLIQDTFYWIQNSNEAHLPFDWTNYGFNIVEHRCSVAEIGFYMISLLGALQYPELLNIAEESVYTEVNATLDQLYAWQTGGQPYTANAWHDSLFYKWYKTDTSPPKVGSGAEDQVVSCLDNAWLAASLLVMRGYCLLHPELGPDCRIYAKTDSIMRRMDFMYCYDTDLNRFHKGDYHDPLGGETFDYLSDEGRVINFIARVLDAIYGSGSFSPSELIASTHALNHQDAIYDGITVDYVSFDGSYSNYTAPSLFIREQDTDYKTVIDNATEIQIKYQQNRGQTYYGESQIAL